MDRYREHISASKLQKESIDLANGTGGTMVQRGDRREIDLSLHVVRDIIIVLGLVCRGERNWLLFSFEIWQPPRPWILILPKLQFGIILLAKCKDLRI
jgi:hypothetical protein